MKRFVAALLALSGFLIAESAHSAAVLSIQESGGSILATLSGSINLTGLTSSGPQSTNSILWPARAYIDLGPNMGCAGYTGISGPTSWGSGGFSAVALARTGDPFYIIGNAGWICVPSGYSSGAALSSSITYPGTFSSRGLTAGTYAYTWVSDSLTVYIGVSPPPPVSIPSLSEWTQLLLALMTIILVGWHFHRERSY